MTELVVIERANILGLELDIYGDTDNPLFLAKDIAKAIGHSNTAKMLEMVGGSKGVTSGYYLSKGGRQEANFLTENQVYKILMRSDKPIAMEIQEGLYNFLKAWRKREVSVIPTKQKLLLDIIEADSEESRAVAINNFEAKYVKPLELENKKQKEYIDHVIINEKYYIITKQIGNKFNMTAQQLNKVLNELGIIYRVGKKWCLNKDYLGIADYRYFQKPNGEWEKGNNLRYSNEGEKLIFEILVANGYDPINVV